MFVFSFLRGLLRYGVTPVFLALAAVNFRLESMGAGHAAHTGHAMANDAMAGAMPASAGPDWLANPVLGSMWLMYLLMALAHAAPWLPKEKRRECCD